MAETSTMTNRALLPLKEELTQFDVHTLADALFHMLSNSLKIVKVNIA